MRRVLLLLSLALVVVLVVAPVALGHDGGEGTYGETDDKVVTNAGFILIAFFPLFVLVMSMGQMALDRRKDRRKAAAEGARTRGPRARRLVAARVGEPVRYERVGAAAVLTIDRPERRNAIDGPTAERLAAAYAAFAADDDARVLVVTGAGGARLLRRRGPQGDRRRSPRGSTTPAARSASPGRIPAKPAIAAIEGWCLAGGLELALWCDLRIATEGSRLGFTERRFGVPLIDGGTQRLPRIVGLGRALDLILSGRVVGDRRGARARPGRRGRAPGRARRPRARDRRGARRLPAGDDARRPPRGLRRPRAPARRRPGGRGAQRRRDVRRRRGRRGALRRGRGPRRGGRRGHRGIGWRPIPAGRDHS